MSLWLVTANPHSHKADTSKDGEPESTHLSLRRRWVSVNGQGTTLLQGMENKSPRIQTIK